jgi:hypothetical protein
MKVEFENSRSTHKGWSVKILYGLMDRGDRERRCECGDEVVWEEERVHDLIECGFGLRKHMACPLRVLVQDVQPNL